MMRGTIDIPEVSQLCTINLSRIFNLYSSVYFTYTNYILFYSLSVNITGTTVTDMITKESYHRSNAANLKPDNIDINRHPVHVGYVLLIYIFSSHYLIKF